MALKHTMICILLRAFPLSTLALPILKFKNHEPGPSSLLNYHTKLDS